VARGQEPLGQPSDVYALAACFAYAVLGREPCRAFALPQVLVEVAERGLELEPLERRAAQGEALSAALIRALRFEPDRRVRSAGDVAALIARAPG